MYKERILIIDSDTVQNADLSKSLTTLGYQVVGRLADTQAALPRVKELSPDVVLMDILLLNESSGVEAAEQISQGYEIPIIYLAPYMDDELMERVRLPHLFGYLLKPIRIQEMRNCLEMVCYKRKTDQKLKHLNAVLHAVRNIGQIIAYERDQERLLQRACETLVSIQGYLLAWVANLNEEGTQVVISASAGPEQFQKTLGRIVHSLGGQMASIFEIAFHKRQVTVCNDLGAEYARAFHERAIAQARRMAVMAVPILQSDLFPGVLIVVANPGQPFEDDEVTLLAELAADLGFALWSLKQEHQRRQTEEALHQRLQELDLVNRLSTSLRVTRNLSDMLPLLLQEVLQIMDTSCGAIYLKDNENLLSQVAGAGWLEQCRFSRLGMDDGIVGHVLQSGQPYVSEEVSSDPYLSYANQSLVPDGWRSVCLPIHISDGILGSLIVAVPAPRQISSDEVQLLSTLTEIASTATQRTLLLNDLEQTNLELQHEVEQRKIMQDLLAQEKEFLTVTLLSIGDGVIATDQDGEITLINRSAEKITGYQASEAIGRSLNQVFQIMDANSGLNVSDGIAYLQELNKDGRTQHPPLLLNQQGEKILIAVNFSTIRTGTGNLLGYVAVFDNITERQQLEAQSALSQKMEAIGQLAAGIAHEINTPIQYVGDNLSFLRRGFQHLTEMDQAYMHLVDRHRDQPFCSEETLLLDEMRRQKKISHYTQEIPVAIQESLEGIERVRKIVLAIREFSHTSTKEKKMNDINHGILTTITISRNEWKYVAEVETDLDPNLPPVYCQIDEINQVILNMIVNAAQAIADVVQRGTQEKGKITIRTSRRGERVAIEIRDSGCGMSPQVMQRIFDPFFTTKGVGKGTGQGLPLAHQIVVKKHGGTIQVSSEVGCGSTFTLELPIQASSGGLPNEQS